jgi:hypothetical protein
MFINEDAARKTGMEAVMKINSNMQPNSIKVQSKSLFGCPQNEYSEQPCWDIFPVYQARKGTAPIICIGEKPEDSIDRPNTFVERTYPNPIKKALQYNKLLDEHKSQAELAQHLGISKQKVSSVLSLLKLDESIQQYLLSLADNDPKLRILSKKKLYALTLIHDKEEQLTKFRELLEVYNIRDNDLLCQE